GGLRRALDLGDCTRHRNGSARGDLGAGHGRAQQVAPGHRAAPRRETDEARRERARAAVTREGREYPIGDTLRVGEPALLERGLAAADELVRDLQQTLACGRVA